MKFQTNNFITTASTLAGVATLSLLMLAQPASATELVINGSFEIPGIPANSYTVTNSVLGWTRDSSISNGLGIEIQNQIVGAPFLDQQFVELDSDGTTAIFQDLATTAGDSYLLSFAFSARPGILENITRVFWDGVLIDTILANGVGNLDTVWTIFSYNLTAVSNSTRLQFDNLTETSDSTGSYLDAVSVQTVPTVPEPSSMLLFLTGLAFASTRLLKHRRKT